MPLVSVHTKIDVHRYEAGKKAKLNFSRLLSLAVDAHLNSDSDLDREEENIRNEEANLNAKREIIAMKRDERAKMTVEEKIDLARIKWVTEHSEYLNNYRNGVVSARGMNMIMRELKFTSRKKCEAFLQSIGTEQEDSTKTIPNQHDPAQDVPPPHPQEAEQ